MKIKTSGLMGAALDWAVGKAQGWVNYPTDTAEQGEWWHPLPHPPNPEYTRIHRMSWTPSTDWSQGGPIIEREGIDIRKVGPSEWEPAVVWCGLRRTADNERILAIHGPTPLIATMRCYVAFKLGDEVDIPEAFD